jgi:hypothetical protein
MTFTPPGSGNPRGPYAPSRERARFSSEFISALLRDFRQGGQKAIERVRRTQPAAYLKICALLVPREMKLEHTNAIKDLTDEELDAAIAAVREMLAQRAAAGGAVIEGTAEPVGMLARAELEHGRSKMGHGASRFVQWPGCAGVLSIVPPRGMHWLGGNSASFSTALTSRSNACCAWGWINSSCRNVSLKVSI